MDIQAQNSLRLSSVARNPRHWLAMKPFAILLIVLAVNATASELPRGLSLWKHSSCQTIAQQQKDQCMPQAVELMAFREEDYVCGWINASSAQKSPSAWFVGSKLGEMVSVRFVDSFQVDTKQVGTAEIRVRSHMLNWKIVQATDGGLIGDGSLKRAVVNRSARQDFTSCEAMRGASPVSIPLR